MRIDRAPFRDAILAAVLAAASIALSLFVNLYAPQATGLRGHDVLSAALNVLACVPLVWRTRWPLAAFCAAQVVDLILVAVGGELILSGLVLLILLYSVAAHRGLAMSAGALTVAAIAYVAGNALSSQPIDYGQHLTVAVIAVAVWGGGRSVRLRRAYLHELKDRATRLERARESDTRAARAEERSRIARELHDVVAHHVSVMTVQAAAARKVLAANPDLAREALTAIEDTGRMAMNEMRSIVGVLRTDGGTGPAERGPQPGVRDLPALVEQMREAGLATELWIEGEPGAVASGVDLAVYRLIQEGLTNSLRHAGPQAKARVTVRHAPRELSVHVEDDGLGPRGSADRTGHGLVGIRERVALYGGILTIGPRPGGGFEVRARFPLKDG